MKLSLLFIVLASICSCSKKDELEQKSKNAKLVSYYLQCGTDSGITYTNRKLYTDSAYIIITKQPESYQNRIDLFKIANRYYNLSEKKLYQKVVQRVLRQSMIAKDTLAMAKANIYLGDYYNDMYIADSAYLYYHNARKLYSYVRQEPEVAMTLLRMAVVKEQERDLLGAELLATNALRLLRHKNTEDALFSAYNILGSINFQMGDYDAAIQLYNKAKMAISTHQVHVVNRHYDVVENNIAIVLLNKKMCRSARDRFRTVLGKPLLYHDRPDLYAKAMGNYAEAKYKIWIHDLEIPKLLKRSIFIHDSLNVYPASVLDQCRLSQYYLTLPDTLLAIETSLAALQKALDYPKDDIILKPLQQLIHADPKNAAEYAQRYITINDSLQLAERKIRNKFARIEYETEELALEKDQAIKEKRIYLSSAAAILMLMAFLFVVYRQKMKQKEFSFARAQQATNEEIYRLLLIHQNKVHEGRQYEKHRISRDLHDGIMNRLASTRLNLFALTKSDDPETVRNCLPYIEDLKEIENEVRHIAHDLSKDLVLGHDSYKMIIENLVNQQRVASIAAFHLEIDPKINWDQIDSNLKINIYRILQECLQNINIHAQASNVTIRFTFEQNVLVIEVDDDGVGFSVKKTRGGIGLKNVISRASQIGAALDIQST